MAKYIKINEKGVKTFPGYGSIPREKLRALKSGEAVYLEEQELAFLQKTCYYEVAAPMPEPQPEPEAPVVEEKVAEEPAAEIPAPEVKAQPNKKHTTR